MRKLAVFLLVLALGALFVWWLDRRASTPGTPSDASPSPPSTPATGRRGETTPIVDAGGKQAQYSHVGRLEIYAKDDQLPGLPLRYHFVARDARTLGEGFVDFSDLHLERFDVQTRTRAVDLLAQRGRGRLTQDSSGKPQLDDGYPITLFETEVTYEVGSRFAPVTLRVPTLEALTGLESGSSKDHVELTGRGIRASGKGLSIDGRSESLRLLEDPRASVQLDLGRSAELTSQGELALRSRPDLGPETAEIEAREQARLVLSGARPFALDADVVRLFGRVEEGAGGVPTRFVPTRGEAEGHVRLVPREGVFTGERALIEFDALGTPVRAALDGKPRLEVVLRDIELAHLPPGLLREGEPLTVQLEGAGPLELFLEERERFLFTGPARLTLPAVGAQLSCDGAITGTLTADGRFEELSAESNARFDYERLSLAAPTLTIRSFVDTLGHSAARLTSTGATTIVGALRDGRAVDLAASGGLVFERRRDTFLVPSADGVTLSIGGRQPLHARADLLRDLDIEASTFVAEGHVEFDNGEGRGRGERLESWGLERGELSGSPESPAHFETDTDSFDALFVELHSDLIHARGAAHAHVVRAGLDFDMRSRWIVVEQRAAAEDSSEAHDLAIDAGGGVHVTMLRSGERVVVDSEHFHALADVRADARHDVVYEPSFAVASGDVRFELTSDSTVSGAGERLELRPDRSGRLLPAPGGRVRLAGELPGKRQHFALTADQADFSPERLTALGPVVDIEGLELAWSGGAGAARSLRIVAGGLSCDRATILLSDGVYLGGKTPELEDWSIDAERLLLTSAPIGAEVAPGELVKLVKDLVAWGGFTARLGSLGLVRGTVLELSNTLRTLSIQGEDAQAAVIERAGTVWSSPRFDLDLDTGYLRSGAGQVSSSDPGDPQSWSLRYDALEPLPTADETIQILRQPVWSSGDVEVRANWALLWLDAAQWRKLTSLTGKLERTLGVDPDAPQHGRRARKLFGKIDRSRIGPWMHELYLDGDVEYRVQDKRRARAESMYLDLVEGHGWLRDFVLDVELPIGGRRYELKLQAKWLRSSVDGTLQADSAVATTCTHDVPHYVIRIGNFTIKPRFKDEPDADGRAATGPVVPEQDGWDLALDDNSIQFIGALALPLPRIAGPMNNDYEFDKDAFTIGAFRLPSFGQDSKFGAFISASFARDIGLIGKAFNRMLNRILAPDVTFPDIKGSTRTHVDLNSRGLVVGSESTFESPGRYRWSVVFDAIYDRGDDHGLVRVDSSDRSELRGWFHSRGRYLLGPEEWLDAVISQQTDPGVQAEFFESDFLRFEERETYLHWRRARDEYYWSATLEARLEEFRSEIIDQPSFEVFKGRSEIGRVAGRPLIQSGRLSIDSLARFDGDARYEAPFADGLGDREVLRFDATQRVESPFSTHVLGTRVTPFVEARATGWSENAAEDARAARGALLAGVQASTTLWKTFAGGARHVWTPAIVYRGDLAHSGGGEPVVFYDEVELPIEGRFLDLSLRSRWENREQQSDLDIELAQSHAEGVAPGQPLGWLPIAARATWLSQVAGMPFGVTHDAHYDLTDGSTEYSRTFLGFEPLDKLEIETGHHFARDRSGQPLYDALTVGARYSFDPKWEVEGKETISARDNGDRLASSLTLRRFGHDFVLEIESSVVAGEGAASLRFNLTPLFAWRRNDLSMLDRWRALRK